MVRRNRSKSSKPSTTNSAQDEGSRHPLVRTAWFERSMEVLDPVLRRRIDSELKRFEQDWLANAPIDQLATRFEYKPIGPPESRNRLKVRQIRLTKDSRIHLTIIAEDRATYLLEVFKKSSVAAQQAAIARSIRRARSLREQKHDRR
jgi:hypothetical protein